MDQRLYIVPLTFLCCFAMACRDKAATAELQTFRAQAQLEKLNRSQVERFFEAQGRGPVEKAIAAVDETFLPGIVTHMAAGDARGLDQVRNVVRYDYLTWSDFRYSIDAIIAEGDILVARGVFGGSQAGRIMGIAPTGKRISYPFIYVFRFENGKIREWWGDLDAYLSMMTQVGLELKPKQAK